MRTATLFDDCPIIAAVKDEHGLEQCLKLDCRVVFILFGNILNIGDIVRRVKDAGRTAIVHIDLISGLSSKEISVDFIRSNTGADGIISTKPQLIRRAKELSLITVQRFFVLDSLSFQNVEKIKDLCHPDFVEILPGVMPKIIRRIASEIGIPVIAGGLITDKDDIVQALSNGAVAISSTNEDVWRLG